MAYAQSGQSLGDLLSGLVSDVSTLFHTEIELAKTEASEKFDDVMGASRNLAIGGVLAIGAIGVFLAAIVSGLAALLRIAQRFVEQLSGREPLPDLADSGLDTVALRVEFALDLGGGFVGVVAGHVRDSL